MIGLLELRVLNFSDVCKLDLIHRIRNLSVKTLGDLIYFEIRRVKSLKHNKQHKDSEHLFPL